MGSDYIYIHNIPNDNEIGDKMRQNSCICVAQDFDIAVAKVVDRYGEKLVCLYHRDEAEMNNIEKIVNLDNNTIYL